MTGSSEKLSTVAVVVAVVAAVVVMSASPASTEGIDDYITPCVDKILNCTKHANYTEYVNDPNSELPCCSVWADQAENERACFCKSYVQNAGGSDPFNMTGSLKEIFTSCKIDLSLDTMCEDVSEKDGGSSKVANSSANSGGDGSNKSNGTTKIALVWSIPSAVILIYTTILAI